MTLSDEAKLRQELSTTWRLYELEREHNAKLKQQLATRQTLYHELLMAVESKWPGETRHQTALRYIRQAERSTTTGPAQEFNN